jgi:hypothetical protein
VDCHLPAPGNPLVQLLVLAVARQVKRQLLPQPQPLRPYSREEARSALRTGNTARGLNPSLSLKSKGVAILLLALGYCRPAR